MPEMFSESTTGNETLTLPLFENETLDALTRIQWLHKQSNKLPDTASTNKMECFHLRKQTGKRPHRPQ